jgi:hypothetical protein
MLPANNNPGDIKNCKLPVKQKRKLTQRTPSSTSAQQRKSKKSKQAEDNCSRGTDADKYSVVRELFSEDNSITEPRQHSSIGLESKVVLPDIKARPRKLTKRQIREFAKQATTTDKPDDIFSSSYFAEATSDGTIAAEKRKINSNASKFALDNRSKMQGRATDNECDRSDAENEKTETREVDTNGDGGVTFIPLRDERPSAACVKNLGRAIAKSHAVNRAEHKKLKQVSRITIPRDLASLENLTAVDEDKDVDGDVFPTFVIESSRNDE